MADLYSPINGEPLVKTKKRGNPNWIKKSTESVVVDEITEKPLSTLLSEMKNLMKSFRHEIDIRISERGGKTSEVEIRVRIQL